jgi:hypothetical protein
MARPDEQHAHKPAPKAEHEWLTTSVADAAEVIAQVINEATRRDPTRCDWVALVDGNGHQIDTIRAEARRYHVQIRIIVDFLHVPDPIVAVSY